MLWELEIGLNNEYSPEQITGRAKLDGVSCVSHECIYQYIWKDKKQGSRLFEKLRHTGRKYRKRGNSKEKRGILKDRVSIDKRPSIVDEKVRFGDLEIDTVIGQNHQGALLTINDRVTSLVWIKLLDGKHSEPLTKATIQALLPLKQQIKTITADNGKEFALHQEIAKELNVDFYFAKPYHSWERNTNENTNGLIRQYFPKGSSFENVNHDVQDKLNNRPRKKLGYFSPNEFYKINFSNNEVAFATWIQLVNLRIKLKNNEWDKLVSQIKMAAWQTCPTHCIVKRMSSFQFFILIMNFQENYTNNYGHNGHNCTQ